MSFKYKITLFTPTYNRAYILDTLYRSVQRQTFRDFEWIVMDDGSTDHTEELVRGWMKDGNDFPIRFYQVPNGGKCRAINRGLDLAEGELFFIMDSDDYLTDNALETVVKWEATIAGKPGYCGVAGNRGSSPTETPNTSLMSMYGANYIDEYAYVRYPEYTDKVVDGERAGVWYTEIHRKYKYPEFEGENFLTPCITWNRMARDGYKIRIFEDIIWVCKYLQDGLTLQGNMRFIKNPAGHGLSIREKAEFLHFSLVEKMKMWYTFYCDHTFCEEQYRITKKQCAEYIGAPLIIIEGAAIMKKVLDVFRGRKIHPILSIQERTKWWILRPYYKYTPAGMKLRKFKDRHKGEICFILGNGPSLSPADLDKLAENNIVTFATNRIYNIFSQTQWRPTYYVCEDPNIIREKQQEIKAIPAQEKFIPIELKWYHGVVMPGTCFYHENDFPLTINEYGFSTDMAKEIANRGTVTFACMQIAAYMGFEKIYLLGVDHNYQVTIDIDGNVITDPNAKDYFCEGYDDDIKEIAVHDMGKNTRAYMGAKAYCDATQKTMIYNATRGGKLEVFERVDFDDVVK